jgi:hypothetical protein
MYQLRGKNLADIVAIYGRGRELFRPPTYLPVNTQYLPQTYMHAACGIRTRNPIKRVASDPRICASFTKHKHIFGGNTEPLTVKVSVHGAVSHFQMVMWITDVQTRHEV